MKKLIVILAIVAIASPVMAAVTISGTQSGSTITVNYAASGNSIRAFAMDLTATTGTITAVNCTSSQPLGYYIYPGSIQIQSGTIAVYGDCVCNAVTFPGVTQPGEGTSAVTVEMGSLYTGTTKPASSGQLLTLTLSNSAAKIVASRNTGRGGIVMEDPGESAGDNLPTTIPGDCLYVGRTFPATAGFTGLTVNSTHLAKWIYLNKPNCWCCIGQKRGNGVYSPTSTATVTNSIDLAKVKNTNVWSKAYTQAGYEACSDFNLDGTINATDLARVKNTNNWSQIVGPGSGCQ